LSTAPNFELLVQIVDRDPLCKRFLEIVWEFELINCLVYRFVRVLEEMMDFILEIWIVEFTAGISALGSNFSEVWKFI
jgi:hypothetical protein